MESPLAQRAVNGRCQGSAVPAAKGVLRTWTGVGVEERGPTDPIDDFRNGARVGGNKVSTGKGFLPVDLVGKGDEVANLAESSLIGKRVERLPFLRGNADHLGKPGK